MNIWFSERVVNKCAVEELVSIVSSLLPESGIPYHLHEPVLDHEEEAEVVSCVRSGYVSSVGEKVVQFESCLKDICAVENVIAVVNGTAALHVLLTSLGVDHNDEVLCPSLTFVGTVNAILHSGATPHFVDCRSSDLTIDPEFLVQYLEDIGEIKQGNLYNKVTGKRLRALISVHVFGHPGDAAKLKQIAEHYNLFFIEDGAESLGSYYDDEPVGSHGIASILSFNGNKIVTTGGGGAVLTNDNKLAAKVRHLTTTAKLPHRWEFIHDSQAFNYRMPNINAALGISQLRKLSKAVDRKRQLSEIYSRAFSGAKHWQFIKELAGTRSNYWLNAVKLIEPNAETLHHALEGLLSKGIHARPIWQPMHLLPMFQQFSRSDLSTTERLYKQIINLPSSPQLMDVINEH